MERIAMKKDYGTLSQGGRYVGVLTREPQLPFHRVHLRARRKRYSLRARLGRWLIRKIARVLGEG